MTDRSRRDDERERPSREEETQRLEDKEKRSDELQESWRRNHPIEEEGRQGRPGPARARASGVSPGTWDAMGYPARSGRLMWGRSPYTILMGVSADFGLLGPPRGRAARRGLGREASTRARTPPRGGQKRCT